MSSARIPACRAGPLELKRENVERSRSSMAETLDKEKANSLVGSMRGKENQALYI
jgi:hypothetical protein